MIRIIKKLKYYYEVEFNYVSYNIEKEIIYKYKITDKLEISTNKWTEIIKENEYYYFDRIAKNKLKKQITTHELKTYLKDNNASDLLINELVLKYTKYNFLNDKMYIKNYLEFRTKNDGKKVVLRKLINKGLDKDLINEFLENIKEDEAIEKFVKSNIIKNKKLNKKQLKQKITTSLINKGYSNDLIFSIVEKEFRDVIIDERDLLIKEYEKLLKKYQNKKEGYELKQFIKNKLYQKGFNNNIINEIIS
ncbi:regulatory protein RecX [Haploplasma modicum]|uniref:RecX family transcriptional regulator n=1 Tax=Haploplasma modicum TaxID=2150 RepID=UPI0004787312|nr:RecX family transcriptional regulator [Haploplasma modicum]